MTQVSDPFTNSNGTDITANTASGITWNPMISSMTIDIRSIRLTEWDHAVCRAFSLWMDNKISYDEMANVSILRSQSNDSDC